VLEALRPHVPLIKDYDTLLFSVVYHDVIYNAEERNNEERSAELAEQRMQEINVPLDKIINCRRQIIATKSHTQSADMDTNFLLDADLSILGKSWEEYVTYTTNIRREYAIYPDVIYNAGRKSVLKHFLQMDRIFKTKEFYERFEKDARDNIEREIAML
jgi:predicted metal-dependent HD superfamily phosphohydrolase